MKLNKQNNFSSFWLGDSLENKSLIENDVDTKPKVDHIKLAGYQRAISNFVNIVSSIRSILSIVPDTISLIYFLYWLFGYFISSSGFINEP